MVWYLEQLGFVFVDHRSRVILCKKTEGISALLTRVRWIRLNVY